VEREQDRTREGEARPERAAYIIIDAGAREGEHPQT